MDLDVNQEEIEGEDNTLFDADDDCESKFVYCDSNNEYLVYVSVNLLVPVHPNCPLVNGACPLVNSHLEVSV